MYLQVKPVKVVFLPTSLAFKLPLNVKSRGQTDCSERTITGPPQKRRKLNKRREERGFLQTTLREKRKRGQILSERRKMRGKFLAARAQKGPSFAAASLYFPESRDKFKKRAEERRWGRESAEKRKKRVEIKKREGRMKDGLIHKMLRNGACRHHCLTLYRHLCEITRHYLNMIYQIRN